MKANVGSITYVHNVFYKEKQELAERPKQENMMAVYSNLDQKALSKHHVFLFERRIYMHVYDGREKIRLQTNEINNSNVSIQNQSFYSRILSLHKTKKTKINLLFFSLIQP